jgi:hypothetical protein
VEAWSKNFIACGPFHLAVMAIIVLLFWVGRISQIGSELGNSHHSFCYGLKG